MKGSLTKHYSCTICQEIFINPSVTNCGHTFCYQCIKKWRRQKRKQAQCPLCRERIRKISPNPGKNGIIEDCISKFFTKEEKDSRAALIEERLSQKNTAPDGTEMGTIDSGNMGCRIFRYFFSFRAINLGAHFFITSIFATTVFPHIVSAETILF